MSHIVPLYRKLYRCSSIVPRAVRDIPDIGSKSHQELSDISATSCSALKQTGLDQVQWLHSYVAGDK